MAAGGPAAAYAAGGLGLGEVGEGAPDYGEVGEGAPDYAPEAAPEFAGGAGTARPQQAARARPAGRLSSRSYGEVKGVYDTMYNSYHQYRTKPTTCHGCKHTHALRRHYNGATKRTRWLDAGCGNGMLVWDFLKAGVRSVRGVELATQPLQQHAQDLLENGTVWNAPLMQLPFADNQFDLIVSTEVFEHVPTKDVPASLAELARVAAPGAKAFVTIGMRASKFERSKKHSDGARANALKDELGEEGAAAALLDKEGIKDFKFHATVQSRNWWYKEWCKAGWVHDDGDLTKVKTFEGTKTAPKGWFAFSLAPQGKVPADCAAMCAAWKKKQGISSRDWCTSSND